MIASAHRDQARMPVAQSPIMTDRADQPRRLRVAVAGLTMPCLLLLPGCSLATLPFKATSKAVDWTTTSQDEADRNHGRAIRKHEEREDRCARRRYADC
jgi:hypothetical protein